jgi:hypothetical protein
MDAWSPSEYWEEMDGEKRGGDDKGNEEGDEVIATGRVKVEDRTANSGDPEPAAVGPLFQNRFALVRCPRRSCLDVSSGTDTSSARFERTNFSIILTVWRAMLFGSRDG